jgi:hypothetical protein
MIYIVPEIALATHGDIVGILDLQEQNLLGRGGLLSVRLSGAFIEAALDDLPQIVARRDGKIVADGSARQPSLRSGVQLSQPQGIEALKKKLVNGRRRQSLIEGALQLVASLAKRDRSARLAKRLAALFACAPKDR